MTTADHLKRAEDAAGRLKEALYALEEHLRQAYCAIDAQPPALPPFVDYEIDAPPYPWAGCLEPPRKMSEAPAGLLLALAREYEWIAAHSEAAGYADDATARRERAAMAMRWHKLASARGVR